MNEYVALCTKIRAMKRNSIDDETFKELMIKKDISSVADSLRETKAYGFVFKDMNMHSNHRRTLEMVLKQNIYSEAKKILSFLPRGPREFIRVFFAKYEIEDIKRAARRIYNRYYLTSDASVEAPSLLGIGLYTGVDPQEVEKARSFEELQDVYKDTVLAKYMSAPQTAKEDVMFYYEMTLDKGLYVLFEKKAKKLSGNDGVLAGKVIGTYCDMLNLQWIYRAVAFYSIPKEVVFNYTIDMGCALSKKQIRDICYLEKAQEAIKAIRTTKYGFLIKDDETTNIFMERRIERYMYHYLKALRRSQSTSIASALEYMVLLEFQLRDVVSIIEAKKYFLPPEEIQKYLIREIEEKEA